MVEKDDKLGMVRGIDIGKKPDNARFVPSNCPSCGEHRYIKVHAKWQIGMDKKRLCSGCNIKIQKHFTIFGSIDNKIRYLEEER